MNFWESVRWSTVYHGLMSPPQPPPSSNFIASRMVPLVVKTQPRFPRCYSVQGFAVFFMAACCHVCCCWSTRLMSLCTSPDSPSCKTSCQFFVPVAPLGFSASKRQHQELQKTKARSKLSGRAGRTSIRHTEGWPSSSDVSNQTVKSSPVMYWVSWWNRW